MRGLLICVGDLFVIQIAYSGRGHDPEIERMPNASLPALNLQRLKAYLATVATVVLACAVYRYSPYNSSELGALYGPPRWTFTGADFLLASAVVYSLLLAPYFLLAADPCASKSLRFFQLAWRLARSPRQTLASPLARDDRVAVLATLLKMFFAPLMAMQLMSFCVGALASGAALLHFGVTATSLRSAFDDHVFWMVLRAILFVDVLVFTLGYLVESPRLGNQIRSVDPTLRGWAVALLCYPPFNQVTGAVLGSSTSEFPQFSNTSVHITMNVMVLCLMAIFAWAALSLGWKASNLTHRGIVSSGAYAWVRHPAYTCKNLAWWIGAAPLVSTAFAQSFVGGLQAVLSVAGVSMLYLLRALTEEDHLRSVDADYAAYAERVRFRFIPGVI